MRPRFHLPVTPSQASWINEVERWLGIMTRKAMRCGCFRKVGELIRKVNACVEHDNGQAGPFVWVARAESMLAPSQRLGEYISGTIH